MRGPYHHAPLVALLALLLALAGLWVQGWWGVGEWVAGMIR